MIPAVLLARGLSGVRSGRVNDPGGVAADTDDIILGLKAHLDF